MFVALDQVVDPAFAQQIGFGFLFGARLSICRSLVHPVDTIYPLLSACCLQLSLQLLLCALFLDFIDALLGSLALGKSLLLFIVDCCLVTPKRGMERLFQV